jgi:hypothetical protein
LEDTDAKTRKPNILLIMADDIGWSISVVTTMAMTASSI